MTRPASRTALIRHRAEVRKASVPALHLAKFDVDEGNPSHIHQHALDVTGDALVRNDFETFALFFRIPHEVETFSTRQVMENKRDLKLLFDNSRRQHEDSGVTHRVRDSISACFKDDTTILCTHVSRIMSGNFQLRDAFPCHSTFERIDGVWLLTRSAYALEESERPFDRLLTRSGAPLDFNKR